MGVAPPQLRPQPLAGCGDGLLDRSTGSSLRDDDSMHRVRVRSSTAIATTPGSATGKSGHCALVISFLTYRGQLTAPASTSCVRRSRNGPSSPTSRRCLRRSCSDRHGRRDPTRQVVGACGEAGAIATDTPATDGPRSAPNGAGQAAGALQPLLYGASAAAAATTSSTGSCRLLLRGVGCRGRAVRGSDIGASLPRASATGVRGYRSRSAGRPRPSLGCPRRTCGRWCSRAWRERWRRARCCRTRCCCST